MSNTSLYNQAVRLMVNNLPTSTSTTTTTTTTTTNTTTGQSNNSSSIPSSSNNSSRNNSTISLDRYHEPSSMEKFNLLKKFSNTNLQQQQQQTNTSATTPSHNNSFALPPISSFDNLVRAAERQYNTSSTIDRPTSPTNISPSPSPSLALAPTDNNDNDPLQMLPTKHKLHKEIVLKPNTNQNNAKKITGNKILKPRRKKQCPICFNYYANLSTHKSTHLTPEDRPHRCSICNRGFARNNDLIRHQKRHWKEDGGGGQSDSLNDHDKLAMLHKIKGTFKCPFNSTLIQLDMEIYPFKSRPLQFETSNCHSTGIFSRCDTYKNHLRALHFEYPPGTKKKDRAATPGRCRNCGAKFNNVDEWLNNHIGKQCGYEYH